MLVPQPEGHPVRSCISLNPKKATLKKAKQFYCIIKHSFTEDENKGERERKRERTLLTG